MGGRQRQAKALERANKIAENSSKRQAQLAKREKKVARRTGRQERKSSAKQNAELIAAEEATANKLAALGQDQDLTTEYIQDEDEKRKKLVSSGVRGAYGFARPSGNGLGGGSSVLG